MPKASIEQSNFIGGEWGPLSQGRHDDPRYSTALALSLNGYPVEEGAWTSRAGTQFVVPTASKRTYANVLPFEGSETCSFAMEFTGTGASTGLLRLITQTGVICTNDAQTIVGSIPQNGTLFLNGNPGWSAGDLIQFVFPDASSTLYPYPQAFESSLRSQVCMIGGLTGGTQAQGGVYFTGNPAVGDTLVINGVTITFVASGAGANQVNIEATQLATLNNLYGFLVVQSGTLGPANFFFSLDAGNNVLVITSTIVGTGGNAVTLTASSAALTLTGATLSGGTAGGSTLTFSDDLGVAIPTTSWLFQGNLIGAQVLRHKIIVTPYTGVPVLSGLRAIQAEVNSIVLAATQPPYELQITTQGTLTADPVFAWSKLTMIDGPYNNPQSQSLVVGATTGTVTLVAGSSVFASTDVGRSVRVFTQPAIYNPASTYVLGNSVTDSTGAWWSATGNVNAGTYPGSTQINGGVATLVWAPAPTAGSWAWGVIATVTDGTHATMTWDTMIPGMVLQSGNGLTAFEWEMGVYSGTTGYPTCGVFYEGRLWLSGAVPNRFDNSTSNGVSQIIGTNTATFSPTDPYGNVTDANGMSLILNSSGINQIQWMLGGEDGVLMGTLHGETVVGASVLGDPITPTSVQAHEHTRYGSTSGVDAIRAGMSVVFPQRSQRRVMEYLADAFSGKPTGRHLNEHSKHLSTVGVARMCYVEEPTPMVYALMNNGLLTGCTYRRFTRFVQSPPEAAGWHWNIHGGERVFTSMCVVPSGDGLFERLFTVTNNAITNVNAVPTSNYFIEIMQPALDPQQPVTQDWFLDQVGGLGPGNSGFDCGGGNASGFTQTGFFKGADSSSSNAPPNNWAGFTPGQSPPWGGVNILGPQQAVFFPGSVALYNLPKYGSKAGPPPSSPTNTTQLSMSVWVGANDFPLASGMLFSSPALTFAQASALTHITSGLLGWSEANYASGATALAMSQWGAGYPGPAEVDATFNGTGSVFHTTWIHVMISAKSDGAGNMVITAAVNDTVLYSSLTQAAIGNNNPMWSFSSQPDVQGDNGQDVWSIGGQNVQRPAFTVNVVETNQPFASQSGVTESILSAIGTFIASIPVTSYPPKIQPVPSLGLLKYILSGGTSKLNNNFTARVTGSGGPQNIPYPTSLGALTGYVGNVAEMWVKPGSFIDWTIAANRYKFHEYDTVTETWAPIPLGVTGGSPGFGAPLVYLSGGPRTFPFNRAAGKYLTEIDTEGSPIDFDTGRTGGLKPSDINFP